MRWLHESRSLIFFKFGECFKSRFFSGKSYHEVFTMYQWNRVVGEEIPDFVQNLRSLFQPRKGLHDLWVPVSVIVEQLISCFDVFFRDQNEMRSVFVHEDHHLAVGILSAVINQSSYSLKAPFLRFGSCIDTTPFPAVSTRKVVHVTALL